MNNVDFLFTWYSFNCTSRKYSVNHSVGERKWESPRENLENSWFCERRNRWNCVQNKLTGKTDYERNYFISWRKKFVEIISKLLCNFFVRFTPFPFSDSNVFENLLREREAWHGDRVSCFQVPLYHCYIVVVPNLVADAHNIWLLLQHHFLLLWHAAWWSNFAFTLFAAGLRFFVGCFWLVAAGFCCFVFQKTIQ